MSFGYGVGDVIAVSTLARTIWGRFRDASDQFRAIQQDVFSLYRLLDDIANNLPGLPITDEQRENLSKLVEGCRSVLDDTEKLIQKNEILDTKSSGMSSKKILRKLKWDSTTVNELRDRMVSSTTFLNAFNTSLASQLSRATNDIVEDIAKYTSTLRLNQSQKDRETILQWLSPLNFAIQQCDLSSRRQAGTGGWFLESPEFQEWIKKNGGTLVCQGMPGAGKTMLASRVIDHLEKLSNEKSTATVYIYCDYGKQEEQTAISLAENVMKQLLQHQDSIPEKVQKLYQYHRGKATRPDFGEVLEMTACSMVPLSRIFLIVDALDELGHNGKVRQSLIRALRKLQDLHGLNLMTTSREIPYLALDFHQPRCMDLRANPRDVRKYVEGHIGNLSKCVEKNANLQETIVKTIVDSVDGMFLLAQLHMDSLSDKTSIKMVKKALDSLPKGSKALDLAYDGAIQRVDSQLERCRHLAKQLLGWLTYSERLMSVQEIQYALAVEPGESSLDEDNLSDVTEIVGYCAGLVIVEEDTRCLRLVHYTTQEYLRQNGGNHLVAAQQDIAISCLTYLLYEEFETGWVYNMKDVSKEMEDIPKEGRGFKSIPFRAAEVQLQRHPFLGYAARYWAIHASVCEQQIVKELTKNFARHDHKVSSVGQVNLVMDDETALCEGLEGTKSRSPLTVMHVLAYIGNKAIFSELLDHGFEADSQDSNRSTPLCWAARGGQYAMVKFLLSDNHVNVNNGACRPLDDHASGIETPLHVAALNGHTAIVELLLGHADIEVNLRDPTGYTPLHSAVSYNYTSIVELLLGYAGIDVNLRHPTGHTPLQSAILYDNTSIVKLLLNCADIDVNTRDNGGRSPLHRAVQFGRTSILKLLWAHPNIDLDSKDNEGRDIFSVVEEKQELVSSSKSDRPRQECLGIILAAIE